MAHLQLTLAASDLLQGAHHAEFRPGNASLGVLRVGPVGLARRIATGGGLPWRPATFGEGWARLILCVLFLALASLGLKVYRVNVISEVRDRIRARLGGE